MVLLLLLATIAAAASTVAIVTMAGPRTGRHNSLRDEGGTPETNDRWRAAALPAGAAVVGILTLALAAGPARSPAASARTAPSTPLELLSLDAERSGDTLTIHGSVRNPSRTAGVSNLEAVVLLYSERGAFLSSGRAVVDSEALGPGRQSQFAVTIPAVGSAGRYRVSFRSDDHLLRHVDRRKS